MSGARREEKERPIRAAFDATDFATAATIGLELYGPELFGYLVALLKSEDEAREAFSAFCEALWRDLPRFRWESTFRTWAYAVARNAMHRQLRDPHRRADRAVPLSRSPELAGAIEKTRTETPLYMRTEVKDQLSELREQLDPDDQTLFILRLNRGMSWNEIARVMSGTQSPPPEQLKREAAALRKRFQRAKVRLGELARERGLVR